MRKILKTDKLLVMAFSLAVMAIAGFTASPVRAQEPRPPDSREQRGHKIKKPGRNIIQESGHRIEIRMKRSRKRTGKEDRVKAAFVFNFLKFSEWPPGTFEDCESPITLCIASDNLFSEIVSSFGLKLEGIGKGKAFYALRNKTVGGRKVNVKECNNIKDTEGCHAIFIYSDDREFVQKILEAVENRNVLTIGEIEGFNRMGGIIDFVMEGNALRYQVNWCVAKQCGLMLRSQLLKSARKVEKCGQQR
ncbi:YfiR family protein [Desulfococcaceae bacterium HSG8]|nr:YfiR family protein [Desulfococcaceae bacterium HSG8]